MATPVLTNSDAQDRLPTKTFTQLFARDGGQTTNTPFLTRMVAATNSAITVWCKGAFPSGLVADGHTPDPIFVEWALDVLCYLAASKHPTGNGGAAAYKSAYDEAQKQFKALTRGQDPAPDTSGTSPQPVSPAPEPETGATQWHEQANGSAWSAL
jgi:hypothetical protein